MKKFSYKFKATNNEFMLIKLTTIPYHNPNQTIDQIFKNVMVLAKKYRMTEDDINLMPFLFAQKFPQLPEGDYTFIVETDEQFDEAMATEFALCFDGISGEPEEDYYGIIMTSGDYEIIRVKTSLLPFI